jgi:transposase
MNTLAKVHVGVDVSKAMLDVFIRPIDKALRVENSRKGINDLNKYLTKFNVQVVACESSGGYENLMLRMVAKEGFNIQHIDPRRIKGFAASEGIKTKTDTIDSKMIAMFAEQKYSTDASTKKPTSDSQRQLKELSKRRKQLVRNATIEKNRLQHPESIYSKKSIQQHLKFIEKEIEKIAQEIKALIVINDEWSNKLKLMTSVPGIGECTATELLASLPELGSIGNKQVASLAGLAPFARESGSWKGKSFVRDGRPEPRAMLYMATLCATRFNEKIKTFYNRLIGSGKAHKVALVASMRKLLVILNTMLRKGQAWDPAYGC